MSFLQCPLCGKSASLRTFSPERFDDDIFAQTVQGLGRGRGFRVSARFSILNKPEYGTIRKKIADRSLSLMKLLVEMGTISEDEILSRLGIGEEQGAANAWVEEEIDDLLRAVGLTPARFSRLETKLAAGKEEAAALQALEETSS